MPGRVRPPASGEAITPNDTTVFKKSRAFMVGVGGDLNVLFANDDTPVLLASMLAGVIYPGYLIQVLASDTTATGIVILR